MADPTAGAALGGIAGAAVGGPVGAAAGAAAGAALASGSVPGKRGTVRSARMAAAKAKPAKAPRTGLAASLGREVADRVHARGQRRLSERRPGSEGTVRPTWRTPRGEGERPVAFVRPATPAGKPDGTPASPTSPADYDRRKGQSLRGALEEDQTRRERDGDQPSPAPSGATTPVTAGTLIAAETAERSTTIVPTSRYTISLEPPATDGEFLEQAQSVAGVLAALAEQVETWTDSLAALNMPTPILAAFQAIPEGLQEAAGQAMSGSGQFQSHFEETRDVAQRGLRFTGDDAA